MSEQLANEVSGSIMCRYHYIDSELSACMLIHVCSISDYVQISLH